MDAIVIEGGVPLKGRVRVSGAKNAALPILAATLLVEGEVRLEGVPDLRDIRTIVTITTLSRSPLSFTIVSVISVRLQG